MISVITIIQNYNIRHGTNTSNNDSNNKSDNSNNNIGRR